MSRRLSRTRLCLDGAWHRGCHFADWIRHLLQVINIGKNIHFQHSFRRYRAEAELAKMTWKIKWEELDGEEFRREKKKKRLQNSKIKPEMVEQSEALLLRSNSRISIGSDKVWILNQFRSQEST